MKEATKALISYTINISIIAGIAAEHLYGLEWAGNISMFCLWFIIIVSFLALMGDPEELFKGNHSRAIVIFLSCVSVLVQVAVGWTVTAAFYLTAVLFTWCKRKSYLDSLKKEEV